MLLVEDEILLRALLIEPLEAAGFSVVEASNGQAAYDILDREGENIRAVITDINLGGDIDGWKVGHRARTVNSKMPVIYTTSYNTEVWSSHGVPESVHIGKPFLPVQLVTAISSLLNSTS